ncbi:MAG: aminomethyltransferase [Saprospiraceae bacterium]|jgi:aminomethyltransferase
MKVKLKRGQQTNIMVVPTPFHERSEPMNKKNHWMGWGGYTVAQEYTNTELEYFAARNQCSVMDLTPMIKYRISGKDVVAYLNKVVTRNVKKIRKNRVAYVLFCNQKGETLDDGTLFRFEDNSFMFCSQDRHMPWLHDSAIGFDVEIEDITETTAALALQGPTSCAVLKSLGLSDVEMMKPFELRHFAFGKGKDKGQLLVSRTGFTGDLGYELWIEPKHAIALWDALFKAGEHHGIVPMGLDALELLRVEAGFILPHVDFMPAHHAVRQGRGRSPIELGFERLIDFDKGFFNGREALLKEKLTGSKMQLVGLDIGGNKPAEGAWVYHNKTKKVGEVLSAMWSPTCKSNVALALLDAKCRTDNLWAEIYTNKELQWVRSMQKSIIVDRPFFNPPRKNVVPAGDI